MKTNPNGKSTDYLIGYLTGCIMANEECCEKGYDENDKFIEGVLDRYLSNLDFVEGNEYTEIDAKDDAIRAELDFWNEMNMEM